MHVCCNLEEIIFYDFDHLLKLATSSLSEEFLAEEVSNLMHHQLVKCCKLWTEHQVEQI